MQVLLPGRTAWRKSGSQTGCLGAGKGTGIRTGCLGAGKGIIIRRDVPGADVPKSATAPAFRVRQRQILQRAGQAQKGGSMEYRFTVDNFEAEVLQAPTPVLVDFYAEWCNPCRMMGPVVARIAEEYEGRVKVGKCNIDENMKLAQEYRVSSIPAFIIFKDGKPAANYVGAMSAAELKNKVEQALR